MAGSRSHKTYDNVKKSKQTWVMNSTSMHTVVKAVDMVCVAQYIFYDTNINVKSYVYIRL